VNRVTLKPIGMEIPTPLKITGSVSDVADTLGGEALVDNVHEVRRDPSASTVIVKCHFTFCRLGDNGISSIVTRGGRS